MIIGKWRNLVDLVNHANFEVDRFSGILSCEGPKPRASHRKGIACASTVTCKYCEQVTVNCIHLIRKLLEYRAYVQCLFAIIQVRANDNDNNVSLLSVNILHGKSQSMQVVRKQVQSLSIKQVLSETFADYLNDLNLEG